MNTEAPVHPLSGSGPGVRTPSVPAPPAREAVPAKLSGTLRTRGGRHITN